MKARFLADANLDQRVVSGLRILQPDIEFGLPQDLMAPGLPDRRVLQLASSLGRIVVTHDVRTMPDYFFAFISNHQSPGLILVPKKLPIRSAIDDLYLIWQVSEAAEWINQMRRLPL